MIQKLRRLMRCALAGAAHYSGFLWLVRRIRASRGEVCVIGLHRVLTAEEIRHTASLEGIVLREETFVRLLGFLQEHFEFAPLSALLNTDNRRSAARPKCILTFDDGWGDNYRHAFLWLKQHKVPATIFLATGMIGSTDTFWIERLRAALRHPLRGTVLEKKLYQLLPHGTAGDLDSAIEVLKRSSTSTRRDILLQTLNSAERSAPVPEVDCMMRWEQIGEMAEAGIDFAPHTVSHPLLTYEDDSTMEYELREGKRALERRLGTGVVTFAYPNGDWNDHVRAWVERTGYKLAVTTERRWYARRDDRLAIPRILLHEGNVTSWNGNFSPAMASFMLSCLL